LDAVRAEYAGAGFAYVEILYFVEVSQNDLEILASADARCDVRKCHGWKEVGRG